MLSKILRVNRSLKAHIVFLSHTCFKTTIDIILTIRVHDTRSITHLFKNNRYDRSTQTNRLYMVYNQTNHQTNHAPPKDVILLKNTRQLCKILTANRSLKAHIAFITPNLTIPCF